MQKRAKLLQNTKLCPKRIYAIFIKFQSEKCMLTTASICGHVRSVCYWCGLNESLSFSANRKLGSIQIVVVVVEVEPEVVGVVAFKILYFYILSHFSCTFAQHMRWESSLIVRWKSTLQFESKHRVTFGGLRSPHQEVLWVTISSAVLNGCATFQKTWKELDLFRSCCSSSSSVHVCKNLLTCDLLSRTTLWASSSSPCWQIFLCVEPAHQQRR